MIENSKSLIFLEVDELVYKLAFIFNVLPCSVDLW